MVTIIIPTIRAQPGMLAKLETTLADQYPGVKVLIMDGGTFAENCNAGAVLATTDIIVFLNDDTEPADGWLEPLVDPILRDPTVAITGAKLFYPDGAIQHAGVYLNVEDGILTARNVCWNAPTGPVVAVTGACMAVRRSWFESCGGFDVLYKNGYEDIDLCLRAARANHQVVYIAESQLIHHESQSGPARWSNVSDNIRLLNERWHPDAVPTTGIPRTD